jgi:hypothetical protein
MAHPQKKEKKKNLNGALMNACMLSLLIGCMNIILFLNLNLFVTNF